MTLTENRIHQNKTIKTEKILFPESFRQSHSFRMLGLKAGFSEMSESAVCRPYFRKKWTSVKRTTTAMMPGKMYRPTGEDADAEAPDRGISERLFLNQRNRNSDAGLLLYLSSSTSSESSGSLLSCIELSAWFCWLPCVVLVVHSLDCMKLETGFTFTGTEVD